jgi:dihydroxyacetone kinase
MEHEHEQEQDQRTFLAETYGDTPTELELAALDEARAFFGEDVRLAIVPNYAVARPQSSPTAERAAELGKTYRALVRVRIV